MAVFAEGAGRVDVQAEPVVAARPPQVGDEAAQLALAEVGVDVALVQRRQMPVGDYVAADDRATAAAAVRVGEDRLDRAAGVRRAAVGAAVGGEALERPSRSWRRGRRRAAGSRPPRSGPGRRRRSRSAGGRAASPGRRRSGRDCAGRCCRSAHGDGLCAGRPAAACPAGCAGSARCSAGRRRSRRRPCRGRASGRGTAAGRRCGWRSRDGVYERLRGGSPARLASRSCA